MTTRVPAYLLASLLLLITACNSSHANDRLPPDSREIRQLLGNWEITLRVVRPLAISQDSSGTEGTVAGHIAFIQQAYSHSEFPTIARPTHLGVYDIDFGATNVQSLLANGAPQAAARVQHVVRTGLEPVDSVWIVLNPANADRAIRLNGRVVADSVTGDWSIRSLLGGGGTFVMRRAAPGGVGLR